MPPRARSTPPAILKPLLARGELQTIGATTLDEYRKHFEKDAALERRFQPIQVHEPTLPHTINILKGLRDRYESLPQGVDHGRRDRRRGEPRRPLRLRPVPAGQGHRPDRRGRRPPAPVDPVGAAGAARVRRQDRRGARQEGSRASRTRTSRRPRRCATRRRACSASGCASRSSGAAASPAPRASSMRDSSPRCSPQATGIPVFKLTEEESSRLVFMEKALHQRVIGQEEAIAALSKTIRRTRAGLKDPKRPIRLVHLRRPHRRRKDRAGQGARGVPVRRRGRADRARHVASTARSTPSRACSVPLPGSSASKRAASSPRRCAASRSRVRAVRRDREGAPGHLQLAPPDPGRGTPDRWPGPRRRLQEHGDHHDHQPRHARTSPAARSASRSRATPRPATTGCAARSTRS